MVGEDYQPDTSINIVGTGCPMNLVYAKVELAKMVKPTLTIMDATLVLMANGPSGGSLDDVKRFDTVAISTDEVALDAFATQFFGRSPSELAFIGLAEKEGLGRVDWRSLKIEEVAG